MPKADNMLTCGPWEQGGWDNKYSALGYRSHRIIPWVGDRWGDMTGPSCGNPHGLMREQELGGTGGTVWEVMDGGESRYGHSGGCEVTPAKDVPPTGDLIEPAYTCADMN